MGKLSAALLLLGAFLAEAFITPAPALRRVPDTVASVHGTRAASFALRSSRIHRSKLAPLGPLFSTAAEGEGAVEGVPESTAVSASNEPAPKPWYKDPVGAFKRYWGGAKMDRKQLAALGASAVCSYGLVSNINYCGSMIAAFTIFVKRNGVSPFGKGQWKEFLTIYGGLWAAMNFLRPVRFWISVGLTPYFDKMVETIAKKTGFRRPVAFGITVFLVNVCGTLTFLSSGLLLASYLTKVPLLPPKVPLA